jgi:anaerobic glycerol-3-phosphate dehydrogenase
MGGGSIGFLSALPLASLGLGQRIRKGWRNTFALSDGYAGILGLLPHHQLKVAPS